MVWYITKLIFETSTNKIKELEKIALDSGKIRIELPLYETDSDSTVRLIEGKNSSFLGACEDYVLCVDYYGIVGEDNEVIENTFNYEFSISVASNNPDTKKTVMDRVKNYLKAENIKFEEKHD